MENDPTSTVSYSLGWQEAGNVNEFSSKEQPSETLRKGVGVPRNIALHSTVIPVFAELT